MTAPASSPSVIIATCPGMALVEDGARLLFVPWPAPPPVASFVLALVAVIAGVNGALAWFGTDARPIALAALAVAACAIAGLVLLQRRQRAARSAGPDVSQPFLIVDRAAGTVSARGAVVASVEQVSFEGTMQLASSSRALTCRWPGGSAVVARGNPFAGSINGVQDALRARGLRA